MLQQDNLPCHVFFSVKASIVYWSEWTCHVTVHNWKLCFVSQIGAPPLVGARGKLPPLPPLSAALQVGLICPQDSLQTNSPRPWSGHFSIVGENNCDIYKKFYDK